MYNWQSMTVAAQFGIKPKTAAKIGWKTESVNKKACKFSSPIHSINPVKINVVTKINANIFKDLSKALIIKGYCV